jgi:hypothetical protein
MRTQINFADLIRAYLILMLLMCVAGSSTGFAQTQNVVNSAEPGTLKSRAEQAAEQQVALSPEMIIDLLHQEPGLLLQVKKMLVRKAYEQGRILDPEDLTDDALFQLLHEDHTICVLATHEIEDRAYIRAKPTLEEIERRRELDARRGLTRTTGPGTQKAESATPNANREDAYWKRHDEDGVLRNAIRKANRATALVLIPTVHAVEEVAEAVVKVAGRAVLIHSVDGVTDLRNALSGTPHLRNLFVRERFVLAPLRLGPNFCAHRFSLGR